MIKAEKFSFSFPQKDLYNKLVFSLEENRHCAFIGTNGTGKSTLVDMICDTDKYIYEGKLNVQPDIRIGHVSQFYKLDETNATTVFEYLSEEFVKIQSDINSICEEMGTGEDLEHLMEMYQNLLDYSDAIDADNYESNIRKQLKTAGLLMCENMPLINLSGGEYKLVCIIKEMIIAPDLLIMDEPDGFLDFDNLNSLMRLINSYKGTMLVITHNRYLLNHCFDKIWHLENTELQEFDGNYIEYNFTLLKTKIELKEQSAKDEEEIERNKKVVEKLRTQATRIDNASFGRQVHARASHLALLEARKIKAPFIEIRQPEIKFHTNAICESEYALKLTDYSSKFDEVLLENVNFEILPTDKVAIVGANGTGKTTMLRDIYKNDNETISISEGVKTAFLSQVQGESFNESHTVLEEFEQMNFENEREAAAFLSTFCFDESILNSKIEKLSGGEKNLLQLAKISLSNANMLLLDEPTSHLDTYSQIALEKAIKEYNGAVLMVSHDFYTIANCADYILFIEDGKVRKMSTRAFRKLIYKEHFDKDYLEIEKKKKELELKIEYELQKNDFKAAYKASDELEVVIKSMGFEKI